MNMTMEDCRLAVERSLVKNRGLRFEDEVQWQTVAKIFGAIAQDGDRALRYYTAKFDKVDIQDFLVPTEELKTAWETAPPPFQEAVELAITRLTAFHQLQKPSQAYLKEANGNVLRRVFRPLDSIGAYVPGGRKPLISSLLMAMVPALIARNPNRLVCTPPNARGEVHPLLLGTAYRLGVEKVYRLGGAQAIAAMALGTETIPKVDKIFGPGNSWVQTAKSFAEARVAGVSVDLVAGPSELIVWADDTASVPFVAEDLLAQAEHGHEVPMILISESKDLFQRVETYLKQKESELKRRGVILSLRFILSNSADEAIELINQSAPEHLSLQIKNYEEVLGRIRNAGAIFCGPFSAVAAGDYVSGLNHILPTDKGAKSQGGLGLEAYYKAQSIQEFTELGLSEMGKAGVELALTEGCVSHAESLLCRLK